MSENSRWDVVFATASWIIVIFLFIGAYTVLFVSLPGSSGPVAQLVGTTGAKYFYGVLYSGLALLLAYAKVFKKRVMRKHVLVAVYITGAFTSILTIATIGWDVKVIDNLVFTFVSAGCWLYWKFKTEYLTSSQAEALKKE